MSTTEIVPASARPSLATSKAVRIRGLRPSDTTYLLTQCILAAHGRGEVVAMISPFAEGAERLHKAGVDMGRILLSVPDSPAMAAEIVEVLVRSGAVNLVIVRGYAEMGHKIEAMAERTGTRLFYAD